MNKLIPFFEVNGNKYEIKPTRYLMAEYDKMLENEISGEDKANAIRSQKLGEEVQKFAKKLEEIENRYFTTFSAEDKEAYYNIKELYDNAFEKLLATESEKNAISKLEKKSVDTLEKLVIIALQEQYNLDKVDAENIWISYVNEQGKSNAVEWLIGMSICLFEGEEKKEGNNDFLSQLRARNKNKKR